MSVANKLPRRKRRGIKSSSAFYQPFTSLWLVDWLADLVRLWRIEVGKRHNPDTAFHF